MSCAIVGYTGFVGSNLLSFYKFDSFYNSSNFYEAVNKEFDTLFFCGIPAVKWYANNNPDKDIETIDRIKSILKTIKANRIILISTIDVYEYSDSQNNEDYLCDFINNHPYGRNRYLFEEFVKSTFANYHIIRLPALFGKGLKKNILFDLIHLNQVDKIEKNTSFQWYSLDWLNNDIDMVLKYDIRVCNLFPEPLETVEILKLFKMPLDIYKCQSNMKYNITTKYSKLFNSTIDNYIRDKHTVLSSISDFLKSFNCNTNNLVVSNICKQHISDFQFACILKLYGINKVQIAPTTLVEWTNLKQAHFDMYSNNKINVYSFQSIAYGLNDNIFDNNTRDALYKHIKYVIDCAIQFNIQILVFGCPKNRKILNVNEYNNEAFIRFFTLLGDYIGDRNVTICIENNSKQYGCNYLNTIDEVGTIVRQINHKNIKMMIDIGNCIMENDQLQNIYKYVDIIQNIDISKENMAPLLDCDNKYYDEFSYILHYVKYNKCLNLEMCIKSSSPNEELHILRNSLTQFINITKII